MRVVPFGTVLDFKTPTSPKCEAFPRRARVQGSHNFVFLSSRLGSNKEEKKSTSMCSTTPSLRRKRAFTSGVSNFVSGVYFGGFELCFAFTSGVSNFDLRLLREIQTSFGPPQCAPPPRLCGGYQAFTSGGFTLCFDALFCAWLTLHPKP